MASLREHRVYFFDEKVAHRVHQSIEGSLKILKSVHLCNVLIRYMDEKEAESKLSL